MSAARLRIYGAAVVLLVVTAIFVLVSVWALYGTAQVEIVPPAAVAFAASSTPAGLHPARVSIPAIGIVAPVQERGLIAGNRMAAPTNYTDIAWYKYGTVPGTAGTAVLYAHLDNGLGLDGVFKNLDQLKLGDTISITTASGTPITFRIDDIETYPFASVPAAALGQAALGDGAAHISLITCAGKGLFDPGLGFTYSERLVIRATYAPG